MLLKNKKEKGFTLIELLVVVAILGVLASVVMVSANSARVNARDVRRSADLNQIIKGLALYFDKYNKYPCHSFPNTSNQPDFLKPLVDEKFIGDPNDPINTGGYVYVYSTLKLVPGGPCGQIAHFDIEFERPGHSCPYGQFHGSPTHCHIFYPQNPNCPDKWNETTCDPALLDLVNDY
ncbi:MAG TPA: prepilin-type N-terminal cleavage/methylation domain-containing protein [Candidatus Binatia bacterium]|nr:prepilin-type N-terminal cleavage/methylation domain-containing protein [Candidatus Binatia bacterium]